MDTKTVFDVVALLFVLTAAFGYLNYRYLRLPQSIGLLLIALIASLLLLVVNSIVSGIDLREIERRLIAQTNFPSALMDGALSFLLFAAALRVDFDALRQRKWTVTVLATVGVAISTVLLGFGTYGIFLLAGVEVPLVLCLVLGAVLSPTDPVAVFELLGDISIPRGLQAIVSGESLFNDGVTIVLFSILLAAATASGGEPLGAGTVLLDLLREAGGAIALGLATGYLAFVAVRSIDENVLELMITLALVTGTYAIANRVGVSGPVAVAVAGLITGTHGARYAMSETTRANLTQFWNFTDEILNSLLFLMIGFEVVSIEFSWPALFAAGLAVPLSLVARFVSVAVPSLPLNLNSPRKGPALAILTWGGLRGGVSVALALSLPGVEHRDALVTVCYAIVVFTVVVQGLTMPMLVRRLFPDQAGQKPAGSP